MTKYIPADKGLRYLSAFVCLMCAVCVVFSISSFSFDLYVISCVTRYMLYTLLYICAWYVCFHIVPVPADKYSARQVCPPKYVLGVLKIFCVDWGVLLLFNLPVYFVFGFCFAHYFAFILVGVCVRITYKHCSRSGG